MDPSASSPTNSSKNIPVIGLGLIVAVLLIAAGYLFVNTQSLSRENKTFANQNSIFQTQISNLKDEKTRLEKDLIFYKNTDLAKEVEILNLKLKDSEDKYEESKKKLSATEANLNTLRQNISTIPKITTALSMMMTTFGKQPSDCYSASDKASIQQMLTAVGDSALNDFWSEFINGTTSANCSMSPNLLEKVINYGLNKISGLTTK